MKLKIILLVFMIWPSAIQMFALPSIFQFQLTNSRNIFAIPNRGFLNQTMIQLKVNCQPGTKVKLGWLLRLSECIDEFYLNLEQLPEDIFMKIYDKPNIVLEDYQYVQYMKPDLTEYHCEDESQIMDIYSPTLPKLITEKTSYHDLKATNQKYERRRREININQTNAHQDFESLAHTWTEGSYLFILFADSVDNKEFNLDLTLKLKHSSGYISATDWPFLPFFSVMCAVYSLYAFFWMIVSALYWRDLIRLQLWIGGVIFLGLIENVAYLAEYEAVNRTGETVKLAMLIAEVISCLKRSLARMLVIIVSLGLGILKPRLRNLMLKLVGIGSLYFVLAVVDGVFRIIGRKEAKDNRGVLAGVPLFIIDFSVFFWIFYNLNQTMRTLKIEENSPKLTLYRHFTNILISAVIASVAFMIWSLKRHRFENCLKDWKNLWLDDGFYHILFSFILLIMIVLWRPSKKEEIDSSNKQQSKINLNLNSR